MKSLKCNSTSNVLKFNKSIILNYCNQFKITLKNTSLDIVKNEVNLILKTSKIAKSGLEKSSFDINYTDQFYIKGLETTKYIQGSFISLRKAFNIAYGHKLNVITLNKGRKEKGLLTFSNISKFEAKTPKLNFSIPLTRINLELINGVCHDIIELDFESLLA